MGTPCMPQIERPKSERPRLVVGISGASGVVYGLRVLDACRDLGVESHLVMSRAALLTLSQETDLSAADVQARADLATAQQQLATLTKRLDQANGRVAQTGAVMPPLAPIQIAQRLKQRVAQAWSGLVPVPPARIPERVNERAR